MNKPPIGLALMCIFLGLCCGFAIGAGALGNFCG